jgi:CHAT domain-containing protein
VDRERFPELSNLAGSEVEARKVAALYPKHELLMGPDATSGRVVQSLGEAAVLHVAAHSHTDALGETRLILAPGDASSSGLLDVESLGVGPFAGVELAVLSACASAEVFPGGSREGLGGPARSLLAAGIPWVVGSLWSIDDRLSTELAVALHRELVAGADPATALRRAQVSLMTHPDPVYGSPATWGAYELFTTTVPVTPPS